MGCGYDSVLADAPAVPLVVAVAGVELDTAESQGAEPDTQFVAGQAVVLEQAEPDSGMDIERRQQGLGCVKRDQCFGLHPGLMPHPDQRRLLTPAGFEQEGRSGNDPG